MRYRVIYHLGTDIDVRTKVKGGTLLLERDGFRIEGGDASVEMSFPSLQEVELFRLHSLGRMIRVTGGGRNLFVTVVHFNIGSFFAVVNSIKAEELGQRLKAEIPSR